MLKYLESALMIATLALPCIGGSFTHTEKFVSSILSTLSSFAPGLALMFIFMRFLNLFIHRLVYRQFDGESGALAGTFGKDLDVSVVGLGYFFSNIKT